MKIILLLTLFVSTLAAGQQEISLYSGAIPNSQKLVTPVDTILTKNVGTNKIEILQGVVKPTLTIYLPDPAKATGSAVIICPGGGYPILATSHEGYDVAKRLNEEGIARFRFEVSVTQGRHYERQTHRAPGRMHNVLFNWFAKMQSRGISIPTK
ncbi:MAG: hypothetical protein U5K54_23820 [Cytophagales bacterium]|nr:hypothetical protein [Cytophagales bacterium]